MATWCGPSSVRSRRTPSPSPSTRALDHAPGSRASDLRPQNAGTATFAFVADRHIGPSCSKPREVARLELSCREAALVGEPVAGDGSSETGPTDFFAIAFEQASEPALIAYVQAMMLGQLLETSVQLAGPAAELPDDDETAKAALDTAFGRSWYDAIKHLASTQSPADLPAELLERLDAARQVRNHLAHAWIWDGGFLRSLKRPTS